MRQRVWVVLWFCDFEEAPHWELDQIYDTQAKAQNYIDVNIKQGDSPTHYKLKNWPVS